MVRDGPLKGLIIRTSVVRTREVGYIICEDPQREAVEDPHAITFRWNAGRFNQGDRNYNARSQCVINDPQPGMVDISEQGYYSVLTRDGMTSADLFERSAPPPPSRRAGGIRSITEIEGKAYAIGIRGIVYRLDAVDAWARIDDGLPETFDGQAIHGFAHNDIYAVGRKGELWHFNGSGWSRHDLPTNANLTSVKCAGDENVYVGGYKGVLLRGRDDRWDIVAQKETSDDIWDLEWFEGKVYVSTMNNLYEILSDDLRLVDFGADTPSSFYQLSAGAGVMWSNGEFDIMSFDGRAWTRVV